MTSSECNSLKDVNNRYQEYFYDDRIQFDPNYLNQSEKIEVSSIKSKSPHKDNNIPEIKIEFKKTNHCSFRSEANMQDPVFCTYKRENKQNNSKKKLSVVDTAPCSRDKLVETNRFFDNSCGQNITNDIVVHNHLNNKGELTINNKKVLYENIINSYLKSLENNDEIREIIQNIISKEVEKDTSLSGGALCSSFKTYKEDKLLSHKKYSLSNRNNSEKALSHENSILRYNICPHPHKPHYAKVQLSLISAIM